MELDHRGILTRPHRHTVRRRRGAVVSLQGQLEQSKQSVVAPGVRGELFEGGGCVCCGTAGLASEER